MDKLVSYKQIFIIFMLFATEIIFNKDNQLGAKIQLQKLKNKL